MEGWFCGDCNDFNHFDDATCVDCGAPQISPPISALFAEQAGDENQNEDKDDE